MARGKLSMFDGDPELGKSLITLDLCARLTTGRPLPDGSPALEPSNVIVLNGEDTAMDTIAPRLRAAGANLDRVFIFHKDFLDRSGPFRLPTHTTILDHALQDTHAVLVVLDPIVAFLDTCIQIVSDRSVRLALAPLADLAAQLDDEA
jgi:RecA-family ATPase